MKIGILTATRTDNNGTDLQALAMQNLFSRYCNDVELINYECNKLESGKHILWPLSLKKLLKFPFNIYTHVSHCSFRRNFKWSKELYKSDSICKISYDIIVVGSDQIWNLSGTGYDLNFFLSFKTNAKKYSYAASLGRTEICKWNQDFLLYDKLRQFNGVSVREHSGISALKEIGITARHDLDPILMGDEADWMPFITKPSKKKYVFLLLVEENKEALEFAKKYALKHQCEIIMPTNGLRFTHGVNQQHFVSVEKWLSYMYYAELIVTNSYHTLSFAVLFRKTFVLFLLNEGNKQSNARMQDLVNSVGLNNQIYNGICDSCYDNIGWDEVYSHLRILKDNSETYIKKIVTGRDA